MLAVLACSEVAVPSPISTVLLWYCCCHTAYLPVAAPVVLLVGNPVGTQSCKQPVAV